MGQVAKRLWKDIKGFVPVAALFGIYYLVSHRLYDAFCPLLIVTGIPCAGCGLTRAGPEGTAGEAAGARADPSGDRHALNLRLPDVSVFSGKSALCLSGA